MVRWGSELCIWGLATAPSAGEQEAKLHFIMVWCRSWSELFIWGGPRSGPHHKHKNIIITLCLALCVQYMRFMQCIQYMVKSKHIYFNIASQRKANRTSCKKNEKMMQSLCNKFEEKMWRWILGKLDIDYTCSVGIRVTHRLDRVLCFLSSRPNWNSPRVL